MKGVLRYFGNIEGDEEGEAARNLGLEQKDDNLAGRKPRDPGRALRELSVDEIQAMMDKAHPHLRALILFAINTGMGSHDIANLLISKLDLDKGWHYFGRTKTGVERRYPLWPETVRALCEVLAKRKEPQDEADKDIVFLTRNGLRYVRTVHKGESNDGWARETTWDDAIRRETGKLLADMPFNRSGQNFYGLRGTFRTIGDEAGDQSGRSTVTLPSTLQMRPRPDTLVAWTSSPLQE